MVGGAHHRPHRSLDPDAARPAQHPGLQRDARRGRPHRGGRNDDARRPDVRPCGTCCDGLREPRYTAAGETGAGLRQRLGARRGRGRRPWRGRRARRERSADRRDTSPCTAGASGSRSARRRSGSRSSTWPVPARPRLVRVFRRARTSPTTSASPRAAAAPGSPPGRGAHIGMYSTTSGRLLKRLPADAAPQHVTFIGGRAYVASGDDGLLRVHSLDGRASPHHPDPGRVVQRAGGRRRRADAVARPRHALRGRPRRRVAACAGCRRPPRRTTPASC